MSIVARIKANGGSVRLDGHRLRITTGKLPPAAVAWIARNKRELMREVWPGFDDFEERAAIREYDGGQERAHAETQAYAEVTT